MEKTFTQNKTGKTKKTTNFEQKLMEYLDQKEEIFEQDSIVKEYAQKYSFDNYN